MIPKHRSRTIDSTCPDQGTSLTLEVVELPEPIQDVVESVPWMQSSCHVLFAEKRPFSTTNWVVYYKSRRGSGDNLVRLVKKRLLLTGSLLIKVNGMMARHFQREESRRQEPVLV